MTERILFALDDITPMFLRDLYKHGSGELSGAPGSIGDKKGLGVVLEVTDEIKQVFKDRGVYYIVFTPESDETFWLSPCNKDLQIGGDWGSGSYNDFVCTEEEDGIDFTLHLPSIRNLTRKENL